MLNPASGSEQGSRRAKSTSSVNRFENYELTLDAKGRHVEQGRGAMGVNYKAFDVDLRCPVTLKELCAWAKSLGKPYRVFGLL